MSGPALGAVATVSAVMIKGGEWCSPGWIITGTALAFYMGMVLVYMLGPYLQERAKNRSPVLSDFYWKLDGDIRVTDREAMATLELSNLSPFPARDVTVYFGVERQDEHGCWYGLADREIDVVPNQSDCQRGKAPIKFSVIVKKEPGYKIRVFPNTLRWSGNRMLNTQMSSQYDENKRFYFGVTS